MAEAEGFESDKREVQVDPGGLKDVFILGKKGMPFYYRGKTKVPFEPPSNLLGVSVKPALSGKQEEELLAYAHKLNLQPEEVGEPIRKDNVRVFRFPPRTSEQSKKEIQQRLSEHHLVRAGGPVIRIDKKSVSFLTNELVVKFKAHIAKEEVPTIAKRYKLDIIRIIPYAGNAFVLHAGTQASYDLLKTCAEMVKSGIVEYAEPNMISTAVEDFTPNDFLLNQQPHHPIMNTEGAWDVTLGSNDIMIAVVDSGCDIDHPDFTNDPALGWVKVCNPFDFDNMDADPTDDTHGTKSCGIATANADNNEGVAGVAPGCRLMPIKRPSPGSDTNYSDMYVWIVGYNPGSTTPGFPAAISPGADVVSNSFGLFQLALSGIMKDTLDFMTTYGRDGKGSVVVFSVGNDDSDFTTYRQWANYEKTIAVAASAISPPDAAEVKISTSNYGATVDVCAPGGGPSGGIEARTMSTTNVGSGDTAGSAGAASNDYDDFGQTSCACPQVAGVAALMLSINPDLTWVEVRQMLRDTAVQIDAANADPVGQWVDTDGDGVTDYSQWYGYGRIDAEAAVVAARDYAHDRDIVVRENLADVGAVPSGGAFWDSPDIWVRNSDPAVDGGAALPASYGDAPPHESPMADQDNWVYVRFKNTGTAPSYDFYVRVYLTHWAGTEFVYPDNYIPTTHPSDPIPAPLVPGTYLIGEVHYSALAAGDSDIVNVLWPMALVPPQTVVVDGVNVTWHPCLLVEISPHDSPVALPILEALTHVWDSNDLAQKNISVVYPADDDTFATAAVIGNLSNRSPYLELLIDRSNVPPHVQLYIELLDPKAKERLWKFVQERKAHIGVGCCRFTFLEETRLLIDCPDVQGSGQVILTLPAKAKLEMRGIGISPNDAKYNFTLGNYKGHEVIWLASRGQTCIPVFADGGALTPMIVGGLVGKEVKSGSYEIRLTQLNPNGQPSGGIAVQLKIGK